MVLSKGDEERMVCLILVLDIKCMLHYVTYLFAPKKPNRVMMLRYF